MTAQELIEQLKTFHPNDEIEIATATKAVPSETFVHRFSVMDEYDNEVAEFSVDIKTVEISSESVRVGIDRVTANNGQRRRILITADEIK
jgi:hypothetical protein